MRNLPDRSIEKAISPLKNELDLGEKCLILGVSLKPFQRPNNPPNTNPKSAQRKSAKPKVVYRIGRRIVCRRDSNGYFYGGTIQQDREGTVVVVFDDGTIQDLTDRQFIHEEVDSFLLSIFIEDSVLCRVVTRFDEYWLPGIIRSVPTKFSLPKNLYAVQVFDPEIRNIYARRTDFYRVSNVFFQRALRFIRTNQKPAQFSAVLDLEDFDDKSNINLEHFRKILEEELTIIDTKIVEVVNQKCRGLENLREDVKDNTSAIRKLQQRRIEPDIAVLMQTVGDSGGKEREHNVPTNITAFAEQTRKQSVEHLSRSFMTERSASPETFIRKADPVAFEQTNNGIRYTTKPTALAEQTRKQSVEDLSRSFMTERSASPETFIRKADPVAFEQINNGIRYATKPTVKDEIQSMTHVISVFTEHDGYGHEAILIQSNRKNQYQIQGIDYPACQNSVNRTDIFVESDRRTLKEIRNDCFALVFHSKDSRKIWFPAKIIHQSGSRTIVLNYNEKTFQFPNNTFAIPISEEKFETYGQNRSRFEQSMIGKTIIGFNRVQKAFLPGTICDFLRDQSLFEIEWCDETRTEETDEHLFGEFSTIHPITMADCVLAIYEEKQVYWPAIVDSVSDDDETQVVVTYAKITQNSTIVSPRTNRLPISSVFFIPKSYYRTAVNLLMR